MKRIHKRISILLTLVMLLGLLPTTALAAESEAIDSVELSVTPPVLYGAPDFDFTVTAGCSIDDYAWEQYIPGENPDWIPMGEGSSFTEGYYSLWVELSAQDGYEFTEDTTFLVNGERLPEYVSDIAGISYYYSDSNEAGFVLWFMVGDPGTYTVSFDAGGGTGTMEDVSGIWDAYILPECDFTAPAGKEFKCWSVGCEKKEPGDYAVLTEDTTVTAVWGTPIHTITISGITKPVAGQKAVTAGIALVAEGMALENMYWLRAGTNNHMGDSTFEAGKTYPLIIHYILADDYVVAKDVEFVHDLPGAVVTVDGDRTGAIKLSYTVSESEVETYTVSFAANGGSGTMADVPGVSGEYTLPANGFTAPSGKAFKCWSVGGEEKAVGDTITVTADTTVTAVWIIPIRTITINGITKPVVGEKAKTSGITLDTEGITISEKHWLKAGTSYHMIDDTYEAGKTYPLLIYYTLADGYEIADDVVITHDLPGAVVTMVKEFSRIRLEYTVAYAITFDANGGSGTMAPVSGIAGEYTLPECTFTAPAGKQFKAWSVGGREKAAGDTITVTADTTLTAVWKDAGIPINAINIMGIPTPIAGQLPIVSGITTDTTGISLGDIIWCTPEASVMNDRLKFEEGKTYTFCADYTVDEGYELLSGAALTHDLAGGFNAKIVPSFNFIEIKYTVPAAPTYTVSFVSDGGSGTMEAVPVVYGEYTLPECTFTPPAGKIFKAWSVGGIEYAPYDTITVSLNTSVKAVWHEGEIDTVTAQSKSGNIAPVYGAATELPELTVTTGEPAYFSSTMYRWLKHNGEKFEYYSGDTFTAGTYHYKAQLRIEEAAFWLANEGLTVTVDGVPWTVDSVYSDGNASYSYAFVHSPDFVVTIPEGQPLTFHDSAEIDIGKNFVNHAITSFSVAARAEGGTAPYSFSKVSGPSWISVSSAGEISGTPIEIGSNADLVVKVTDSAAAEETITIAVADTKADPDTRTKVSIVIAESASGTITPVYNAETARPELTVTTGEPAYFSSTMYRWLKHNGEKFVAYSGDTFTAGTYRYTAQIRIDEETHVLAEEGLTVTVDGEQWTMDEVFAENTASYSYVFVYSPVFVVTANYAVSGTVEVSGSTAAAHVTVDYFPGGTEGALLVAQYRGGQMVDVKLITIEADGIYQPTGTFGHQPGDHYRAFLVDAETYAPLCAAAELLEE